MGAATEEIPTTQALSATEPRSIVEQLSGRVKQIEKGLARFPPARLLATIPRTGRFAGKTVARRMSLASRPEGPPVPRLSPGLLMTVALDEAALLVAMGPNRFPRREEYMRVGAELKRAVELYEEQGWLDDPASYHREPPPLERPQVTTGWALGTSYERLWWESGFEPWPHEPGRQRWIDYATNNTATAWMLRHRDGPRPWVVCIHGFGMGQPFMEFMPFDVARLHKTYGLNVIGPTLPLHGPRKVSGFSGEAFLGFDMMNSVHGLAQSIWDIRRLLSWIRATQEPTSIGAYGFSLGGYVLSLVAGFEDLDLAIAGIPVSNFPTLFHSHAPTHIRLRAYEHEILGGRAERVHGVVSPMAFAPKVARDRRYIYAALGDRMARPPQAYHLWKHWEEPTMLWFDGGHISFLWSRTVRDFVRRALVEAGVVELTDEE